MAMNAVLKAPDKEQGLVEEYVRRLTQRAPKVFPTVKSILGSDIPMPKIKIIPGAEIKRKKASWGMRKDLIDTDPYYDPNNKTIYLAKEEIGTSVYRQSIAHELCHYLCHSIRGKIDPKSEFRPGWKDAFSGHYYEAVTELMGNILNFESKSHYSYISPVLPIYLLSELVAHSSLEHSYFSDDATNTRIKDKMGEIGKKSAYLEIELLMRGLAVVEKEEALGKKETDRIENDINLTKVIVKAMGKEKAFQLFRDPKFGLGFGFRNKKELERFAYGVFDDKEAKEFIGMCERIRR